jgi:hypothetical protein
MAKFDAGRASDVIATAVPYTDDTIEYALSPIVKLIEPHYSVWQDALTTLEREHCAVVHDNKGMHGTIWRAQQLVEHHNVPAEQIVAIAMMCFAGAPAKRSSFIDYG